MGADSVASHQDYLQGINTGMAPAGASRARRLPNPWNNQLLAASAGVQGMEKSWE